MPLFPLLTLFSCLRARSLWRQLPLICTQTAAFLQTAAQAKLPEGTPAVATAVLDHPTTLATLDNTFGSRESYSRPITDVILVQKGEELPAGYSLVRP